MAHSINFVAARLTQPQEAKLAEQALPLLQYVADPAEAAVVSVRPEGEWPSAIAFHGEADSGEWRALPELFRVFGPQRGQLLEVPAWKAYCEDADLNLAVASLAARLGTDAAHLYYSEEVGASGFSLFQADGVLQEAFSYGAGGGDALLRYKNGELSVQNLPRDMLPFDYAAPFFEGLARFFGLAEDDKRMSLDFLEDVYSPNNCIVREYSLMEDGEKLTHPLLRD